MRDCPYGLISADSIVYAQLDWSLPVSNVARRLGHGPIDVEGPFAGYCVHAQISSSYTSIPTGPGPYMPCTVTIVEGTFLLNSRSVTRCPTLRDVTRYARSWNIFVRHVFWGAFAIRVKREDDPLGLSREQYGSHTMLTVCDFSHITNTKLIVSDDD